MKLSYIIDGYNLLHAMGILAGKVNSVGLARARQQLLEFLAKGFGDEAGRVTVVFDAKRLPPRVEREQTYKGLVVLLAAGHDEADDLIEKLIAEHGAPKQLVVVSSDHRLKTAARHRHARPMDCQEFLDALERRPEKASPPSAEEKQDRPTPAETRHWLEEFAGMESDPELKEALRPFDFEKDDSHTH